MYLTSGCQWWPQIQSQSEAQVNTNPEVGPSHAYKRNELQPPKGLTAILGLHGISYVCSSMKGAYGGPRRQQG